jgi:hypothetical protein
MKKFLVLLGGIALVSAGTAFALDLPDALQIPGLTVSGEIYSGLQVNGGFYKDATTDDDETDPVVVQAYSDDIGDGTPFRAHLKLAFERDNIGAVTRFRYQPDGDKGKTLGKTLTDLNILVNKAFIYGNLLDGKAKVTVGKGLDAAWGLFFSNYSGDGEDQAHNPVTGNKFSSTNIANFDGKDGVQIQIMPIEGLNVGMFYGTGDLLGGAPITDGDNYDHRFVFGAKYSNDTFAVVASLYHNFNDADNPYYNGGQVYPGQPFPVDQFANFDAALPNASNLLIGAQLKNGALPIPLAIDLSIGFVNLGTQQINKYYSDANHSEGDGGDGLPEDLPEDLIYKDGKFNPYWAVSPKLSVVYKVDDKITAGLEIGDVRIADQYYYDESANEDGPNDADGKGTTDPTKAGMGQLFPITFTPYVSYAITEEITGQVNLNLIFNHGGTDVFGFGIKPKAEFSLGSGATFVVWDSITFYSASKVYDDTDYRAKHETFSDILGGKTNGFTTNTLQFDFVWKF